MKFSIRKNVFETNSSSTHAITLDKDLSKDFPLPKSIYFGLGKFSWEWGTADACDYIYTASINNERNDFLDYLRTVLEEEGVEYRFEKPKDGWYYVDHSDNLNEFIDMLMENKQLLKSFLITGEVYTGNDNDEGYLPDNCFFYKGN